MQYLNLGLSVCETKAFGPCGAEARALEYILGSSVVHSWFKCSAILLFIDNEAVRVMDHCEWMSCWADAGTPDTSPLGTLLLGFCHPCSRTIFYFSLGGGLLSLDALPQFPCLP